KWVIPAGKSFDIKGFYVGEKFDRHLPFTILDGEEAVRAVEQLGEKAHYVQLDVFENLPGPEQKMTISARGLPEPLDRAARKSYAALSEELLKASSLKRARGPDGGELIVAAEPRAALPNPALTVVTFEKNPLLIG